MKKNKVITILIFAIIIVLAVVFMILGAKQEGKKYSCNNLYLFCILFEIIATIIFMLLWFRQNAKKFIKYKLIINNNTKFKNNKNKIVNICLNFYFI